MNVGFVYALCSLCMFLTVLSRPAMQCGATVTTALTHISRHICTRVLTTPERLEDSQ